MTYSTIVANAELKEANTNRGEKDEKKKKFDYNLESLRGFLAIFVVIYHLILFPKFLDPNYFPQKIALFEPPGHYCVFIFFILSGYVIGLSNKSLLSKADIFIYLKKRLIRLYPIYFIALTFTLLIASTNYSFQTILSHFTITQVAFTDVIWEISPSWSLHYEIVYYLLFIPISFFNINPIKVLILSITIGLINYLLYPTLQAPIVTSYAFGLTFWSAGLAIAKYFKNGTDKGNYNLLLSNLFLILSIYHFNFLATVLTRLSTILLGHPMEFPSTIDWSKREVALIDLAYLPFCIMFVLVFTGKEFRYKKQLFTALQILPGFTFYYILKNIHSSDIIKFLVPTIYYIISLLLFFIKYDFINLIGKKVIEKTFWLGSISYAIYIIHMPLLVLFKNTTFFSGSLFTFSIRLILFFCILIPISYLLDRKLQPWVRQKLI